MPNTCRTLKILAFITQTHKPLCKGRQCQLNSPSQDRVSPYLPDCKCWMCCELSITNLMGASLTRCLSCLCQSQMSSPKADLTNLRGSADVEAGRAQPEGQTELCHMAGDAWEANNSYSVCEQGKWHQLARCQQDWGSDLYLLSYRCGPSPQPSPFLLLSSLEEASQEGVPYYYILTFK